jgi:biopolymer transport protein ExbD
MAGMRMLAIAAFLATSSVVAPAAGAPSQEAPMHHDLTPGVELPQVAFTGLDVEDDTLPDVSVSPTALTIRGEVVVPLVDGELAQNDVEDGVIPRLREAAASLPPGRLALQVDRRVPYRTLVRVIHSLHAAGRDQHVLLARAGAHVVSAPIALASSSSSPTSRRSSGVSSGEPDDAELVVSLTRDELRLWSRSGAEGTREHPKLAMHVSSGSGIDLGDLASALAEIRARRGAGEIVVLADGSIAMQSALAVIGAVRATADGAPLYPEVRLASLD